MKIITVVGARPQFIKAAVVSRALKEKGVDEKIIHTGQHFDQNMSDIFFKEMEIPKPDYNLNIQACHHGAMTGRMMEGIEKILLKEKPKFVLVYGDTNSTLAGALAAKKLHINLAHVEAGLRSFNMQMPEEVNRILTDRISTLLFCPTLTAIGNLAKEGFNLFPVSIIKSGDVMYDGALFYAEKLKQKSLDLPVNTQKDYMLVTLHRAENTDDPERLQSIVSALNKLSKNNQIVLPLHPRTRKALEKNNIMLDFDTVEPVGYLEMIHLLQNANLVMTDSGGLQKEAYFFGKYCLTLRDETEWTELVKNKVNILCGSDKNKIIDTAISIKDKAFPDTPPLFGAGNAGQIIADELINF